MGSTCGVMRLRGVSCGKEAVLESVPEVTWVGVAVCGSMCLLWLIVKGFLAFKPTIVVLGGAIAIFFLFKFLAYIL